MLGKSSYQTWQNNWKHNLYPAFDRTQDATIALHKVPFEAFCEESVLTIGRSRNMQNGSSHSAAAVL